MPAATTTSFFSSASPNTQASLIADVKKGMADLGYATPYDEIVGTTQTIVYEVVFDSTKTKGKVYLAYFITSTLAVSSQISDNWNLTTHTTNTSTNSVSSTAITFASTTTIQFITFSSPELKLLFAVGSNTQVMGWMRPANKPTWWNEDTYSYCFIPADNTLNRLLGLRATASPYGTQTYDYFALSYVLVQANSSFSAPDPRLSQANPITGVRDFIAGCLLYAPLSVNGGFGIAGKTSADIIEASSFGTSRFDKLVVSPGAEEYILVGATPSALGLRIV